MATINLVPTPTPEFIQGLQEEERNIETQINALNNRKHVLLQFRKTYASPTARRGRGIVVDINVATKKAKPGKKTGMPKKGGYGRGRTEGTSTMEMARQVLTNEGKPQAPDTIRASIKQTFGVEAAPSLHQMLYKRAYAKNGFFKTGMKYGLLEWRKRKAA